MTPIRGIDGSTARGGFGGSFDAAGSFDTWGRIPLQCLHESRSRRGRNPNALDSVRVVPYPHSEGIHPHREGVLIKI